MLSRAELRRRGCDRRAVAAQVAAGRWQSFGEAVVLHNGPLTREDRWEVGRLAVGADAVLTAFTAAEALGLRGWERDVVHVLGTRGSRLTGRLPFAVRLHRTADWSAVHRAAGRPVHRLPDALVLAASTFRTPRPACGLLAAAVQQRLARPEALADALQRHPRQRHHRALGLAVADIAGGAEALSEIDFARLCRRGRLPEPRRQSVRVEPSGRRRYLDAEWDLPGGRRLVAEVDGALHLTPRRWWDDQLRQNVVTLSGALVLRFPSVVVREEPGLVLAQLRQGLRSSA